MIELELKMSNQSGAMKMLRSMRDGARRSSPACPRLAAIFIAAIITVTMPGTAESRTTRVRGAAVVSAQLTDELWLHTKVRRLPLFCRNTRTLGGHVTRRTTHEFQTFVTVGPDPNGRRSRVEHLRLTFSIGDREASVEDCRDADWCPARYQEDCARTCATGEAWDHGRHAITGAACLAPR